MVFLIRFDREEVKMELYTTRLIGGFCNDAFYITATVSLELPFIPEVGKYISLDGKYLYIIGETDYDPPAIVYNYDERLWEATVTDLDNCDFCIWEKKEIRQWFLDTGWIITDEGDY